MRKPRLVERGAAHDRDSQTRGRRKQRHLFLFVPLVDQAVSLRHGQVEWKLYEAEAMMLPCNLMRDFRQFEQVHVIAGTVGHAESTPGRDSIELNSAVLRQLFKCRKCIFQALAENLPRDFRQLRL